MTDLSLSEFRNSSGEMLKRVTELGEHIVLHRRSEPLAVIVPLEDAALIRQVEDYLDFRDFLEAKKEAEGEAPVPWERVKERFGL